MTTCFEPGTLRAYLDQELTEEEAASVASHVATCSTCAARLAEVRMLDSAVGDHLATGGVTSGKLEEDSALERLRERLAREASAGTGRVGAPRRGRITGARRASVLAASAAAVLLIVLVVPGTRALAGQLLGVFRAQSVVYVQVPQSRVEQLRQLQGNANALFLVKPQPVGAAPTVQTVGSLEQAATALGFTPQAPATLPGAIQSTAISVQGQSAYSMRVNVKTVRQVLQALGVTDVTVPDALGARPITITMPPAAEIQYQGTGYSLKLIEGTSPTVNLPPGVSLEQLGRAALEVYGMAPDQAARLSRQIDWSSTLVFPFPQGTNNIQQVTVDGTQGVLVQTPMAASGTDTGRQAMGQTMLYWQHGARFYILIGQGVGDAAMLTVADSVR